MSKKDNQLKMFSINRQVLADFEGFVEKGKYSETIEQLLIDYLEQHNQRAKKDNSEYISIKKREAQERLDALVLEEKRLADEREYIHTQESIHEKNKKELTKKIQDKEMLMKRARVLTLLEMGLPPTTTTLPEDWSEKKGDAFTARWKELTKELEKKEGK